MSRCQNRFRRWWWQRVPLTPDVDRQARQREQHHQRLRDERQQDRGLDRLADARESRTRRSPRARRSRSTDTGSICTTNDIGTIDREIPERDVEVQRVRRRRSRTPPSAPCTKTAPAKQLTSAPGSSPKLRQRAGQRRRCGRRPIPDERPSAAAAAGRSPPARTRPASVAAAPARNPAHSHTGQIGAAAWCRRPIAVAPSAATSTSAIRPSTRSTSTTVVASVFELRVPRRVADADDVAADVARQKVVEEQSRPETSRAASGSAISTCCAFEQQMPAPGAREHVDGVDARARRAATATDACRAVAQSVRDVDPARTAAHEQRRR